MLLVEGSDDEHVLRHICGVRRVLHIDEVKPQGGVDELLRAIPVQLRASGGPGDVVGIVIDANDDLHARWQSIRDRLIGVGYGDVPQAPAPSGIVLEPPEGSILPKTGVWMMPDNLTCGTLEDFLRCLIPEGSPLFGHVVASVDSIPDPLFSQGDRPKALLHTWLAWQATPGRPYGTAIEAGFLDPSVPEVDALVSWLNRLYFEA